MPSRCCVPMCKGNYPTGPKVSVFSFPKDKETVQKWLNAIQRKNFEPNKNSRICELHFKDSDIETDVCAYDGKTGKMISAPLKIRRLKTAAVPSIFPNYPPCNVSKVQCLRKCPENKRTEREMMYLEKGLTDSVVTFQKYEESRKVQSLQDIERCVTNFGITEFWTLYKNNSNTLFFLHIEPEPEPYIQYSVKINDNMDLTASAKQNSIKSLMSQPLPKKVQHFNDIVQILDFIENDLQSNESPNKVKSVVDLIVNLLKSISNTENENVINFIQQQLVFFLSSNNHFRYSPEFLIFSCILKSISPHAYNFIRQSAYITLPHPDTLRRVCNNLEVSPQLELNNENFLMYISSRIKFLEEYERTVILLIDEIHIKPFFDYKGGSVIGAAVDSNNAATSAFVFMVSSILSPFKEVAYIMPVKCINFQALHEITKKVIVGLENINVKVICVVTDNNAINGRALSLFVQPHQRSFVYPHPIDNSRPLFFLIDSVHNFKNIRNNWLNQKNHGTCFYYPDFDNPQRSHFRTASFMAVKKIYEIESNEIIKYAKGLTLKSISPSNLERQNVKLVLKVFNKFVVEALLTLGPKHNIPYFEDTSKFIEIICNWWDIFNVKTASKGNHQRNVLMEPLNGDTLDEKYIFLNKFLVWLDTWENMNVNTGTFSKETHKALVQTTHGMLELTSYCINECKMRYILTGKIQTDCLEARFGKYRQMAGSQYHISIRQLLECEKKLRIQSCIKLELPISSRVITFRHFDGETLDTDSYFREKDDYKEIPHINITEAKIADVQSHLPVLTYLAGYCSHAVNKKLKCSVCKEKLVLNSDVNLDYTYNLIKNLDHGGLKCPSQFVVTVVMYNYIIVNNITLDVLAKFINQRSVIIKLSLNALKEREIYFETECSNCHESEFVCKLLLCASTNIMLKNLCLKENDNLSKLKEDKKNIKKRKLLTMQK